MISFSKILGTPGRIGLGVSLVMLGLLIAHAADPVRVEWITDPADARLSTAQASGVPSVFFNTDQTHLQDIFPVFVGINGTNNPPMSGSYQWEGNRLIFTPQFPLEKGLTYLALFQGDPIPGATHRPLARAVIQIPKPKIIPTTVVEEIYPTSALLPENLLKFYVHFSRPMKRGNVYQYIHLRDDRGTNAVLPFLEIGEELWDQSMTRITLIIDPGRIKRGVQPLVEMGPVLEAGKRYTLTIDPEWEDEQGSPMKQKFVKEFRVGPADRTAIDPKRWKITSPKFSSVDALVVDFSKSMDEAVVKRAIHVVDGRGQRMEGKIQLADQERRWSFIPKSPWQKGAYQLVIATLIEDLAGNNIGKVFDVDLFENEQAFIDPTVALPFSIE